jgi:redox-sensitive bicupin YhaK (pirin superfamily)
MSSVSVPVSGSPVLMPVIAVRKSKVAYPTGRKDFAVMQTFPAAVSTEEADPFLMCDLFGPTLSHGVEKDPDTYPVDWHPHRGMDIATYIVEGRGRHADSMGNRGCFDSPGMQWCSVGSGIEHAEAGGTPAGQNMTGFQARLRGSVLEGV